MKKKPGFLYYLGNGLIIASFAGFAYIFYPLIKIYLFPPVVQSKLPKNGSYVTIPKIRAQAQIYENIDPYNSGEYEEVLKTGVAHAKDTSLPGENGTVYLFAHSSAPPWEITRSNTVFLRLSELSKGDFVEIQKNGKIYRYKVREKKEVLPADVNYLKPNKANQLILQTCTPIGTDWKRLLVFADPA